MSNIIRNSISYLERYENVVAGLYKFELTHPFVRDLTLLFSTGDFNKNHRVLKFIHERNTDITTFAPRLDFSKLPQCSECLICDFLERFRPNNYVEEFSFNVLNFKLASCLLQSKPRNLRTLKISFTKISVFEIIKEIETIENLEVCITEISTCYNFTGFPQLRYFCLELPGDFATLDLGGFPKLRELKAETPGILLVLPRMGLPRTGKIHKIF